MYSEEYSKPTDWRGGSQTGFSWQSGIALWGFEGEISRLPLLGHQVYRWASLSKKSLGNFDFPNPSGAVHYKGDYQVVSDHVRVDKVEGLLKVKNLGSGQGRGRGLEKVK